MPRPSIGSVFRRRYRDRHGRPRLTANWYVVCLKPETAFEDLETLIVDDYRINVRDSLYHLQHCRLARLREFFGGWKACAIRTRDIERYKLRQLGLHSAVPEADAPGQPVTVLRSIDAAPKGAAAATINRELSTLRRMFRLAIEQKLISTRPRIVLLREHNVRTGFFEWDQFTVFLSHLPRHHHALFQVAFITGWRVSSELLTRRWSNVDFSGGGTIRIEPGEAKDATEGREFPFTSWMRQVLQEQRRYVRDVERQTGKTFPGSSVSRTGSPFASCGRRGTEPGRRQASIAFRTTSEGPRCGISSAPACRERRR
jgi:integrase